MVHYNLAGRVNSEEYAICERLLGASSSTTPVLTVYTPLGTRTNVLCELLLNRHSRSDAVELQCDQDAIQSGPMASRSCRAHTHLRVRLVGIWRIPGARVDGIILCLSVHGAHDDFTCARALVSRSFHVPTSSHLVICDVIVWSDTGRLLCTDVDAFSTFVQRHYSVQLDLSDAEVMLHIKANMDEMRAQQSQHPGRAR